MLGVKNIDLEYIDGRTKRTIFSDVSFDIQSGEFVSLLGPSGSGKSSLLYIVSLLKTPTAGEIYLDDVLISGAKNKNEIRYENFGFVFQHHFLIPHLTVLENVCTASYEKNVEKQAKDLLERLGLKDLINQKPYKLSGGERQRVAIARAVVKKPRILFADESITGDTILEKMRNPLPESVKAWGKDAFGCCRLALLNIWRSDSVPANEITKLRLELFENR